MSNHSTLLFVRSSNAHKTKDNKVMHAKDFKLSVKILRAFIQEITMQSSHITWHKALREAVSFEHFTSS